MPHVSLAAEKITSIFGFSITNSLLATWLVMGILFLFTWAATRKISLIPSGAQMLAEVIIGGLYDFFEQVTGDNVKKFFPLVASLFLFIIVSNWMGLLPGVGTIGLHRTHEEITTETSTTSTTESQATVLPHGEPIEEEVVHGQTTEVTEFVPVLRAATADLNTTVALALISVFAIQYFGYRELGFHYTSRFIVLNNPIMFAVGILELVSEIAKVISFGFRLFGNIFAGEVLLTVIAFLIPFIAPLPFLAMELFVGMIQALVFSMLTAVFAQIAVSHGEHA